MHSANVEGPSSPILEDDRSSDNEPLLESATGSTNVEEPSSPILDDDRSIDNFITHDDNNLPPSSPQTPTGTRVRVTAQNPVFGFVEGAMRGNQKLGKYVFTIIISALIWTTEIRRPNMLRPRITDRATATKRFHRELNNIITRVSHYLTNQPVLMNHDLYSVNDFHRRRTAGWCLLLSIAAQDQQPHILHLLTYGAMRWMIL